MSAACEANQRHTERHLARAGRRWSGACGAFRRNAANEEAA
jgi:hypothetical protein